MPIIRDKSDSLLIELCSGILFVMKGLDKCNLIFSKHSILQLPYTFYLGLMVRLWALVAEKIT